MYTLLLSARVPILRKRIISIAEIKKATPIITTNTGEAFKEISPFYTLNKEKKPLGFGKSDENGKGIP